MKHKTLAIGGGIIAAGAGAYLLWRYVFKPTTAAAQAAVAGERIANAGGRSINPRADQLVSDTVIRSNFGFVRTANTGGRATSVGTSANNVEQGVSAEFQRFGRFF